MTSSSHSKSVCARVFKRCGSSTLACSVLLTIALMVVSNPTIAAIEHRDFANDQHRELYIDLIRELRCLVCQNQNLAESNADLAKDLRNKTYDLISEGKDRHEIVDFMVQRYGDFVLYRPPFNLNTAFLWLGPLALLLLGLGLFVRIARQSVSTAKTIDQNPEGGIDINAARQLLDNFVVSDTSDGTPDTSAGSRVASDGRSDPTQANKQ